MNLGPSCLSDRGKRRDEPREIIFSVMTLKAPLADISRGECSDPPVRAQRPKATEVRGTRGLLRSVGKKQLFLKKAQVDFL